MHTDKLPSYTQESVGTSWSKRVLHIGKRAIWTLRSPRSHSDHIAPAPSSVVEPLESIDAETAVESKYFKDHGDVTDLLDPVTGDVMQPGKCPESLLSDERLAEGLAFLHEHGSLLRFSLLLSRHASGKDLEDSAIDIHTEAREIAANNGVLFLENISTNEEQREKHEANLAALAHVSEKQAASLEQHYPDKSNLSFSDAVATSIAGTGVKTLLPDFGKDSAHASDQTLATWYKAIKDKFATAEETGKLNPQYLPAYAGFVFYRNWYLIAKMGKRLADVYGDSPITNPIDVRLLVGTQHEQIGHDLEAMNMAVAYKGELPDHLTSERDKIVIEAVKKTSVSSEAKTNFLASVLEESETEELQAA